MNYVDFFSDFFMSVRTGQSLMVLNPRQSLNAVNSNKHIDKRETERERADTHNLYLFLPQYRSSAIPLHFQGI